jgi:double-strand break repair protein MRE11
MKYRPTKIPLKTVRPYEYAEVREPLHSSCLFQYQSHQGNAIQVVLEEQEDVDPNDEWMVHAHLDKVVGF